MEVTERQNPPMSGLVNAHRHWQSRRINTLVLPDGKYISAKWEHVNSIIPYSEPGEMAHTIWFEVHYENGNRVRHNGSYIAQVEFVEIENAS